MQKLAVTVSVAATVGVAVIASPAVAQASARPHPGWQYWLENPISDMVIHYQPHRRYQASFFTNGFEECTHGHWKMSGSSLLFNGKRRDTNLVTGKRSRWFKPSDGGPNFVWQVRGTSATLNGANRTPSTFTRYTYRQFTTHPEAGRDHPRRSRCFT